MHNRVQADIMVSDRGVESVDVQTPCGHRGDAFALLERLLPSLRDLNRAITVDPAKKGRT
jgi:hypothetical protein